MLVWRKVINLGDSAVGLSGPDGAQCSNGVSPSLWCTGCREMGPGLAVIMQLTPSWENGKYIVQNIHFSMQSIQVLVPSTPFHSIAWQILSNTILKKNICKKEIGLKFSQKSCFNRLLLTLFLAPGQVTSPRLSLFITAWTKLLHFFCLNNLWSDCDMAIVNRTGRAPQPLTFWGWIQL